MLRQGYATDVVLAQYVQQSPIHPETWDEDTKQDYSTLLLCKKSTVLCADVFRCMPFVGTRMGESVFAELFTRISTAISVAHPHICFFDQLSVMSTALQGG